MLQLRHSFSIIIAALAIVSCIGTSGCAGSEESAEILPPRTEIHYSSGGGVSGMSSGFSILHDGTVTQWTGRGSTVNDARILGRLEIEQHAALLETLGSMDLAALRQQETGNMTTSLRIVRGEEEFLFTWPGLHLRKEEVPSSVRSLVDAVWSVIEPFAKPSP